MHRGAADRGYVAGSVPHADVRPNRIDHRQVAVQPPSFSGWTRHGPEHAVISVFLHADQTAMDLFQALIAHSNACGKRVFAQADWETDSDTIEYNCVETRRMLIEKSSFSSSSMGMSGTRMRFWLTDANHVVEKYFGPDLVPVGWFMPVCEEITNVDRRLQACTLYLGMVANRTRKLVVTGERLLERAVVEQRLTRQAADRYQERLRQLRKDCLSGRFPPAIVRNFELDG